MSKNIFVLAPTHSQPRYHKRVDQLSRHGEIIIFYFSRNLYSENKFKEKYIQINLGNVENRNYYKRVFSFLSAYQKIKDYARLYKPKLFYAFGIDLAVLGVFVGFKRGYLEIGDLVFPKGLGRTSRVIEYILFNMLDGVVFTSSAFLTNYNGWRVKRNGKMFVIDNKLSDYFRSKARNNNSVLKLPITIGVIGFLRYELPLRRLVEFVRNNSKNVRLLCYGDGPFKNVFINESCDNIKYMGSFKNPEQLEEVYRQIDINYVVYDNTMSNERLAIPNKLFESIYWGTPLIVSTNTYLYEQVEKLGVGGGIDYSNQDTFDKIMDKYSEISWVLKKRDNCFKIKSNNLFDNGSKIIKQML